MRQKIKKVKEEGLKLRKAVRERLLEYLLAAFGLVAGLAWNDAVRTLIENVIPTKENTIAAKFLYAFLVTLLVAAFSMYFVRLLRENPEEN